MKPDDQDRSSEEPVVHQYDDIVEHDNELPRWWLYSLYGAVAFALFYWLTFHSFGLRSLPAQEYKDAKAAELARQAEEAANAGEATPQGLLTMSKDPATVARGKKLFEGNCVTCHAAGGRGDIGPNLTDAYWIYGGDPMTVYKTVHDGAPRNNQMPSWFKRWGSESNVRDVVAYVITLKNTNAPGGKAPQGEPEK